MLIKQKFLFSQDFFANDFGSNFTEHSDNLTVELKTAMVGLTF
jgi:hypothetical protein